jgi:N-acetylmuramoyl-L-alanine amidase
MRFLLHHLLFFLPLLVIFFTGCSGVRDTSRTFETVVIDAGHGGHDSGARARAGYREKDFALDVARRLDARLREAGFRTVMTRQGDVFVPLGRRTRISNSQHNAIFVSVHFNDADSRTARGVETYYKSRVARETARRIELSLDSITNLDSRGVKTANFFVLRKARYPAVLVECGFLSNAAEAERCASPEFRDQLAVKVAEALVRQRFGNSDTAESKIAAMHGQAVSGRTDS